MTLDSILLTGIVPAAPKSAASHGSNSHFDNSARAADSNDNSNAVDTSGSAGTNGAATAADSESHSSSGSSSHSTHSSTPSRSSSGSGSSNASESSKRSSSSSQAGRSSSSGTSGSSGGAKAHGSGKAHGNAGGGRAKTNNARTPTPARGTKGTADAASSSGSPQGQSSGPTFLQALAQSQADAAAAAGAASGADTQATDAAGQGTGAKSKNIHDDAQMPLAFLPQSVAAAMAGAQGTTPPQSTAQTSGDSAESDSTDPISATAGSASQTILASLKGPDDLKIPGAVGDPAQANGQTAPAAANTALTPDGTNAAAVAFQAHMSVSSHLQQSASTVSGDKVEAPVGTPAFNDEIGGKITWLANQGVQSASLQLSPEHLGPVNVHILVHDGSATVSFNAAHADTRTALEQALPRLREMFSTQGLTLTDASVSHQSPRGQPQKQAISSINAIGAVSDDSSATSITSVTSARLGLVDTYA